MSKVKCIVHIKWAERGASHEQFNAYVTNEDGTPRIFESLTEARSYIAVNHGFKFNGYEFGTTVWARPGVDRTTFIRIIREDSKEYAEIIKQIETAAARAAFEASRPTAEDIRAKYDSQYLVWDDAAADPEDLEEPAPIYQRYELLAYLGDPDAYDVEAIEAEATRYTADGARVWSAFGEDLAAIAERHELVTYYAI